jgi:Uma2 family endonuclease
MGMLTPRYYTAQMVMDLPNDGNRYEVVRGELLVSPAPRPLHQVVQFRVAKALAAYLERQPAGYLFTSPADISWGPDSLVQPDVFVVPLDEARTLDWSRMQGLLLAVEVLSPSSVRADRFTKRRLYQEVGIPLYWVVDPDAHEVEVWTPDATFPAVETGCVTWHPAGAHEPFVLDLASLCQPI